MKKKILKLEDLEFALALAEQEIYKNEIKLNNKALALTGGRPIKQKTLDEIFKITIIKKGI
jgi:hypothetical protein